MRIRSILLLLVALVAGFALTFHLVGRSTSTEVAAERVAAQDSKAYVLPPDKMDKAVVVDRTRIGLTVVATVWSLVQLVLILRLGVVARMRDTVVRMGANRWVQGLGFVFLLLLVTGLLDLPLAIYGHRVSLAYGLSVQGWGSWLDDKAKVLGLELADRRSAGDVDVLGHSQVANALVVLVLDSGRAVCGCGSVRHAVCH